MIDYFTDHPIYTELHELEERLNDPSAPVGFIRDAIEDARMQIEVLEARKRRMESAMDIMERLDHLNAKVMILRHREACMKPVCWRIDIEFGDRDGNFAFVGTGESFEEALDNAWTKAEPIINLPLVAGRITPALEAKVADDIPY